MNYIIVTLLLASLAIRIQAGQTIDEVCQQQLGASDEDVKATRQFEYPRSRMQMSLYDCIFQAAGYSDGRRFQRDGYLKHPLTHANVDRSEAIQAIAEKCDGISNKVDSCQLAADILTCMREELLKLMW